MALEITQLNTSDFDEGLDFLNAVFGKYRRRHHDFHALLPSLYQPTDKLMSCNHALREDGEICAIVGLYPIDWQVGDRVLKVGGIGGVSTHPAHRNKGHMSRLMAHCVEKMHSQGFHLSFLGGQRQRYGYAGYEKAGQEIAITLGKDNVRHACGDLPKLRFEPIAAGDMAIVEAARLLHNAQLVHCHRTAEHFYRFLLSWYNRPFGAFDDGGDMMGYLVANPDRSLAHELLAVNPDAAVDVACAWVMDQDERDAVDFQLPPLAGEPLRRLAQISEATAVRDRHQWRIFDWAAVVEALMIGRSKVGHPLLDGQAAIGIEGYGTLIICVEEGEPRAFRADEPAPATWHPFIATRALFGPLSPAAVTDLAEVSPALSSWCPLPLSWTRQDSV